METMGDRIKALREARGMTTSDVARHLGILAPNYRKYENGERNPKQEQIEKMARLFGCRSAEITENRIDYLCKHLNSLMVGFAVSNFESYESVCLCWDNFGHHEAIESFFLDMKNECSEDDDSIWRCSDGRKSQLKEIFRIAGARSELDERKESELLIRFMALFIDYFHHRRNYDAVLSEVKDVLGIEDNDEARIQFACRVVLPTFSILRGMAMYCEKKDDPDLYKAFALAAIYLN